MLESFRAYLRQADYTILSPYLLPAGSPKRVNIGDGFILDSAIKLIGAAPGEVLSSRAPLGEAEIARINAGRCLVAAGANTLKDDFELAPGFDLRTLDKLRVPIVLLGIGHYGTPAATRGLSPASRALFEAVMARFPFVSVRCDASRRYLAQATPGREGDILMTSCPVAHAVDGLDRGFPRKPRYDQLVVTLTDRSHLERQLPLLAAASARFPVRRRVLALHQDYGNAGLWALAEQQGFEVFRSPNFEDFLALYAETDLHVGNRVHAHLKCLSYGNASFCTPFDLRQAFFAESLDFPLIDTLPSAEFDGYDFNRFRRRRDAARADMDRFIAAIRALLDA